MARRWALGRKAARGSGDAPLTAAANVVDISSGSGFRILREAWQQQVWGYYHSQGEYRYAIDWAASANSRVRLRAARIVPGADEPEIIDSGLAAEIMGGIGGGMAGQAELMSRWTVLLQVPGDSYSFVTGEVGRSSWDVHSVDSVKTSGNGWQVQIGPSRWAAVPPDAVAVRIHNADPQFPWLATSPSQSVTDVLNEIDLYNRHIVATLTSRLASNGIIVIPQEVSFPGLERGAQAPNALVSQFIEVAKEAIREPGSAGAAIPLVIEVPAQYADAIRHLSFASELSEDVIEARDKALTRLARSLNVPAEILTGVGGVNHWGAWQIEDSAIKIHLTPIVETICGGVTKGYLHPALAATGMRPDEYADIVAWYDLSELQQKPDLSANATTLHDRVAISDAAYRRANGFDESAAPTDEEREEQILSRLAYNGQQIPNALTALTGTPVPESTVPPTDGDASNPPDAEDSGTGPSPVPDTIADIPEFDGA